MIGLAHLKYIYITKTDIKVRIKKTMTNLLICGCGKNINLCTKIKN